MYIPHYFRTSLKYMSSILLHFKINLINNSHEIFILAYTNL